MSNTNWRPVASIAILKKRAALLGEIRHFFAERNVWEVDVPVWGAATASDLHIDSVPVSICGRQGYLQTSPEYFLKRLLAADSGAIYSLGHAFREGESGSRHNPEFTLLEWYRPGWSEIELMDEVAALVVLLAGPDVAVHHLEYAEVFSLHSGLNPHQGKLEDLQQLASSLSGRDFSDEGRSTCLDLIFSLAVEPCMPDGLVFVRNYPACQSALAKSEKTAEGLLVARRFEAFFNRIELANGYFELTDPVEQRSRFRADNAQRQAAGKPLVPLDENLLGAMEAGLPACAGVALGVDRLLMACLGLRSISAVMAFPVMTDN